MDAVTADKVRAKLQGMIDAGKPKAMALFERLERFAPRDRIVSTKALDFAVGQSKASITMRDTKNGVEWGLHRNAISQLVGRTNGIVTATTADKMVGAGDWGRDLLVHNLRTSFHNGERERALVRSVVLEEGQEEARGFLSDKYRRLNTGPIMQGFAEEALRVGAVPIDDPRTGSTYSLDLRCGLGMFMDRIFEPVPNEWIVVGLTCESSDFGCAALTMRFQVLRIWCSNLHVTRDELRKVHLGSRLSEDILFSEDTYASDTKTMSLAVRDMVHGLLSPKSIDAQVEKIRSAATDEVNMKNLLAELRRGGKVLKGEAESIAELYNTPEVELMPAGQSRWRAANAISLFAGNAEAAGQSERAVELRAVAGEVLDAVKI